MKRQSTRPPTPLLPLGLLVLTLQFGAAAQSCMTSCGDCNLDGQRTVLDALEAAQISVGMKSPTPEQDLNCDVEPTPPDGDIDVLDALYLARKATGLPVSLGCFPVIIAPEGYGVPVPVVHAEATQSDPDRFAPNFDCALTTVFFEVRPDPATEHLTITVTGMSSPTDFDLYIGAPGVPAGDTTVANYLRRSRRAGAIDETYDLACSGLLAYGGQIAVAVHAVEAGIFEFAVSGNPSSICSCGAPTIEAGQLLVDMIGAVAGPCPPLPCNFTSRQYSLDVIPAGTTRLDVVMVGPPPAMNGDYDLWMGYPGVCAGDCFVSNFHGSSILPGGGWDWGNPLFAEIITLAGTELASYGAGPMALGVSVFTGPVGGSNFTLDARTFGSGGAPLASSPGLSPVDGSLAHCRIDTFTPDVVDRWEFSAAAGQTIEVYVDTRSSGGAFDPQAELRMSGAAPLLAAADDVDPCTEPPPVSGGTECPRLIFLSVSGGLYEVSILRGAGGFCRDAANGAYRLEVTVDGVPVSLTPLCDDC